MIVLERLHRRGSSLCHAFIHLSTQIYPLIAAGIEASSNPASTERRIAARQHCIAHGFERRSNRGTTISFVAANSQISRAPQPITKTDAVRAGGRRARRRGACAGFTLIEVVVALAVVAILLTAIGAVVTTSSRGTRSLEQRLALVETSRIVAATLPKSEQIGLDGLSGEILGHRWRVGIAPFFSTGVSQVPGSPWIPQTVVVRVRSPSGAVFGFETVRLQHRVTQ